MAAPTIILNRPFILVTLSGSVSGISVAQGFGFQFGTVQKIFPTCDRCVVGDSVLFEPDKGVKLVYGSTIYFMIEEENSSFVEIPIP